MTSVRPVRGFTLVEMMVTLVVVIILATLATPSFIAMRQRAALRGAAEETLGLWNQTRFEAAKRNATLKFGVMSDGDKFCVGVATDTTSQAPCDCLSESPSSGDECDVAQFPAAGDDAQNEWNGVTLGGTPTIGPDTTNTTVLFDPRRNTLVTASDAGGIALNGPTGPNAYQLNLMIDQFGRGVLCETASSTSKMSDYGDRQCTP